VAEEEVLTVDINMLSLLVCELFGRLTEGFRCG